MKRKVVSGILLTLLLTSMLTLAFNIKPVKADSETIIVPDNYPTIQEAINNAHEGDMIYVRPGVYLEHVVIDKRISLVGEDRETTIIDGQDTGTVVTIRANDVNFSGFAVQNGGPFGVAVELADGCDISRNLVRENSIGIRLWFSNNCVVSKNVATNNREHGISLDNANSAHLIGNTVNENSGIGVLLAYSDNTRISNNQVENNDDSGILIDYSRNSTVIENTVTSNGAYGIILRFSNISVISRNSATDNILNGIELYVSNDARVSENNIKYNGYSGIRLNSSSNNRIYHNNFIDNTEQASLHESFNNAWDDGYPSGGNYWSDYKDRYPDAEELEDSGIWDTPYVVNENNQDNYPLMNPWVAQPPMDWDGINERANVRKQLYQLYHDKAFSPSWWKEAAAGLVEPISELWNPLTSTAEDLFLIFLPEALGETLSIMTNAYTVTEGFVHIFLLFKAMEYDQIALALSEASKKYNIQSDLSTLMAKVDAVLAACDAQDFDELMVALGEEQRATENLYKGTVEYEKGIWLHLMDSTIYPVPLPWSKDDIYCLLVKYPHYDGLDHRFSLDIKDGHLVGLRLALEANYLDVTDLLGARKYLNNEVTAPLTQRYGAPLVNKGYWTVDGVEVTDVEAGTVVVANVVLTTYDSMKASGDATVEVWRDMSFPFRDRMHMSETHQINLNAGETAIIQTSFRAAYARNPFFRGYYLKVNFTGDGISNNYEVRNKIRNVWATWIDTDGDSMESNYPPRLKVTGGSIIIRLGSLANLLVTSPDGLHVGYDLATDNMVNEIESAMYSGPETEPEVIMISSPLSGVYDLKIFGTGTGTYSITIEFLDADNVVFGAEAYAGETVRGAVYVYDISITDEVMTASPDPVTELEHLKEFIVNLPTDIFAMDDPDEFAEFKKEMFDKIDETLEELYENKYMEAIEKLNEMKEEVMEEEKLQLTMQSDLCVIIDHIISNLEMLHQSKSCRTRLVLG